MLAFLVAQVGKGAFGNVRKMRHTLLNKVFAVKQLRDSMDPQCRKQLITDLGVIQKSNCQWIVQSYGFCCAEVCLFLFCSCVLFLVVVVFGPFFGGARGEIRVFFSLPFSGLYGIQSTVQRAL